MSTGTRIALFLILVGFGLVAAGFLYDALFAGIPYQDPPPALLAEYHHHAAIASQLMRFGGVGMLSGFVSLGGVAWFQHRSTLVRTVRSVLGVVAGYVVFAASAFLIFALYKQRAHQPATMGFMVIATVWGMFFAAVGGYLSGWLAGRNPRGQAVAVALVMALGASVSLIVTLGHGVIWSQVTAITLMAPCAAAAGWIRRDGRTEQAGGID